MTKYRITKQATFYGEFMGVFVWLLIGLLTLETLLASLDSTVRRPITLAAIVAGVAIAFYSLFHYVRQYNILKRRPAVFKELAAKTVSQHTVSTLENPTVIGDFDLISLKDLKNVRNQKFYNYMIGPDWSYCDYQYSIYKKTKSGEYEASRVYYGVMMTKLSRSLPNIFFDSYKARKRQFRYTFSHEQVHGLEGNFDKYFATYFPVGYTIDSMSFVGPDVMEALINASDYDIEIVGNKLFMYGAMVDPTEQIEDMTSKILNIKRSLKTEIKAYRDERLPGNLGRQQVALVGQELKHSKFLKYVSIGFAIVVGIVYFLILVNPN